MPTVIPTNNTDLLQALARLTSQELATVFDLAVITKSRIPDSCPPEFIPWLAWERSIGSDEGWNITDTEIARRKLIENYIQKHQHKGTPSVIRRLSVTWGTEKYKSSKIPPIFTGMEAPSSTAHTYSVAATENGRNTALN